MYFSIWFNGIYNICAVNMVLPYIKWWRPIPPAWAFCIWWFSIVQNSKIYSIKCEQERKSHFSHERFSNNNHCQNRRNHNRYCGQPCKCVLSYSHPTQNIQNRFYPMGACASVCVYDDVFCVHVAICYCSTCYCYCGVYIYVRNAGSAQPLPIITIVKVQIQSESRQRHLFSLHVIQLLLLIALFPHRFSNWRLLQFWFYIGLRAKSRFNCVQMSITSIFNVDLHLCAQAHWLNTSLATLEAYK